MIKLKISILFRRSEAVLSVAERKKWAILFLKYSCSSYIVSREISLDFVNIR